MIEEYWNIGIIKRDIFSVIFSESIDDVNWLPIRDDGSFRADPFGIYQNGKYYVICEHYNYRDEKPKGKLHLLELSDNLDISYEKVLMEADWHISYPFLFENDSKIYICPETYEKKSIDLYLLNLSTFSLEYDSTIAPSVQGIDPTIFFFNGLWWMFFGDFRLTPNKCLYLAHSENFHGPWKLHKNCELFHPLVSNFSGARMAGRVFEYEDSLYRLGQHCIDGYGKAVCVFKILELTSEKYKEELVKLIKPVGAAFERYRDGLHHISPLGNWTLIDAKWHQQL